MKKIYLIIFINSLIISLSASELQIYFLDVAQGDATLIMGENGKTLLIDAGNNGKGNSVIVPFLDSVGISHLDYIIATHYHADHIGGIDEVILAGIEVDTVYDRGSGYTTQTYFDYIDAIGTRRNTITEGKIINLGDSCSIQCVVVNGKICNGDSVYVSNDENAHSIGLLIDHNNFEAFIGGDLTGGGLGTPDVESAIAHIVGDIETYRVNHHGSATSTNQLFLDTILPEVAIISTGNNTYGHPAQEVLDRLENCGETQRIYQTEAGDGGWTHKCAIVDGHISLVTDGLHHFSVNEDIYYIQVSCDETDETYECITSYPNPFSEETTIEYFTTKSLRDIELNIYNVKGQIVKNIHLIPTITNIYIGEWDGTDKNGYEVGTGIYFYTIGNKERVVGKIIRYH